MDACEIANFLASELFVHQVFINFVIKKFLNCSENLVEKIVLKNLANLFLKVFINFFKEFTF